PGDPGLLTARALELIAHADTILYDRLIPSRALTGARSDAELLFVGKNPHRPGGESVPQEQTEALMIERARAGREVVRLKGGDPFVFGRGGEEASSLREAGIDFQVVPGVTAGVAAAAYAGIPVTHRGVSTGVALVTGHEDPSKPEQELDWSALAAFPGTLVFYMGVRALARIADSLTAAGRPASQPVALVERGTLPDQRTVRGTLATIAEVATREDIKAPAITVVGDVVGLSQSLAWLEERPLAGLSVAVTRARAQASGLAARLEDLGASVVQAPTIRVRELSDPARPKLDLSPYDLVCLTSANGVRFLFKRLTADGLDARALAGARIAAIGPATVTALAEHGIVADIVPAHSLAESLVEALSELKIGRALMATGAGARDTLPAALRERGVTVDVLALYETVAEPLSASALEAATSADYVVFASGSSVRFFLGALRERVGHPGADISPKTRIASIGPVTSTTLSEHGLRAHVEASQHDVEGLVQAILADAEREHR
ncbi:MAG: uroporphyrinogen-III C-methyltransferase, partial [Solirubrobacteraceae bacterium]